MHLSWNTPLGPTASQWVPSARLREATWNKPPRKPPTNRTNRLLNQPIGQILDPFPMVWGEIFKKYLKPPATGVENLKLFNQSKGKNKNMEKQ